MKMKTKTKVLIGTLMVLVLAVPLITVVLAEEGNGTPDQGQNRTLKNRFMQFMRNRQIQEQRLMRARAFFGKAEPTTVEGTVVAYHGNILIVNTENGRLNVQLPQVWNLDTEIVNVQQLCEEYLTSGTQVSIKALQTQVTNDNGVTVTIIQAYVVTAGENTFYPVLPFNISTED